MWQTFLIWRTMNAPLPVFNPFRKLLKLKLPHSVEKSPSSFWSRASSWLPSQLIGCLVGLGVVILTVFVSLLCIIFITPVVFLFFGSIPALMFMISISFGGYLSFKITNKLGKIRVAGIYDLIGVTAYGDQRASWLIGRTIYKDILWLKDTRIMMSNSVYILIGFLTLMSVLGTISALTTPATSTINLLFLETVMGLGFLTIAVYLSFVQAMVIGYLLALWSINLTGDGLNRLIATVGGFVGSQLVLYLIAYLILAIGLPTLYIRMKWDTFITLGLAQLIGLAILHEILVRMMLRVLARQAELPYAMWRSEIEI
jgi:hypothetical protein